MRDNEAEDTAQNVPSDYIRISSGLGERTPRNSLVLPVVFEGQLKGSSSWRRFDGFSHTHQAFLEQLIESIGIVINTIEANMRTEDLLKQSQSLAQELQQPAGRTAADEPGAAGKGKAACRTRTQEVERKNREVEQARQALEDKAQQLALTCNTSPSSSRTCRTNCARRSTAC